MGLCRSCHVPYSSSFYSRSQGAHCSGDSLEEPDERLEEVYRSTSCRTSGSYASSRSCRTEKSGKIPTQCGIQMVESTSPTSGSDSCQVHLALSLAKLSDRGYPKMGDLCDRVWRTGHQTECKHCDSQRTADHSAAGTGHIESTSHGLNNIHRGRKHGGHQHAKRSRSTETGQSVQKPPRRLDHHAHSAPRSQEAPGDHQCRRRSDRATRIQTTGGSIFRVAFQWGRYIGLSQIVYQWPDTPQASWRGLGWSHSICDEFDFKDPWTANHSAFCDAFDIGFVDKVTPQFRSQKSMTSSSTTKPPAKTVTFSSDVDVQFCSHDSTFVTGEFRIDHSVLSTWTTKPWSLHQEIGVTPIEHRTGDVDPPQVPGRELHRIAGIEYETPAINLAPFWIQQLWPTFIHKAALSRRSEHPLAWCRAWFLDDELTHEWSVWRELELDPQHTEWQQKATHLFRDQVLPGRTLEFHFVTPPIPPIPGWENQLGDLILVQAADPSRRAVLVSTLLQHPWEDRRMLRAYSFPHQQPRHELLRKVGLMFPSWRSPCTISRGTRLLWDGIIAHLQGSGLFFLVDQREQTSDVVTFMQGAHQPIQSPTAKAILSWTPPFWESDVFGAWIQYGTITCAEDGPSVPIQTWYIHHDHHRIGFASRIWNVIAPMATWERQLRELWHDLVDPQQPLRFHLVAPTPPSDHGLRGGPHLLLVQGDLDYKAILITAIHEQLNAPALAQAAFSSPMSVDGHYIQRLVGVARPCEEVQCTLRLHSTPLDVQVPLRLQDGMSFEIDIPQLRYHDDFSLLTTSGSRSLQRPDSTHSNADSSDDRLHTPVYPCDLQDARHDVESRSGVPLSLREAVLNSPDSLTLSPTTPNWLPQRSVSSNLDATSLMQIPLSAPHSIRDTPDEPRWYQNMRDHHHGQNGQAHEANSDHPSEERTPSEGPEEHSEYDAPDESPDEPDSPGPQQPPSDTHRQSVMLFLYGQAPIHAYVAWHSHDAMMQEIANHCLIPIHHILQLHDLAFTPLDLQTNRGLYAMIVHRQFDIPHGSSLQLCLVDVEVFGQQHEPHYYTAWSSC